MEDFKILKQDYKVVFGVFLGTQLMSIVINIISLSCSNWYTSSSLTDAYPGIAFIDYIQDCEDSEWCNNEKKLMSSSIACIILAAFGMLSKAVWMCFFSKSFYMKFYFKLGLILGLVSFLLQLIALIQYMAVNKLTFERKYDDDYNDINPDYNGQAGDGPRLSLLVVLIDLLLLCMFLYTWRIVSIRKLTDEPVVIQG
ncbi:hypothetical protein SteCoe_982 [Stentor coeruleus]|uniref:MARVEL domain-containing protein n=1 Tax=Stentor coeruleus TaxID=5963 RepID=A0A1R2D2S3_9CILI|nr:hypothetical protein SteCoe_982 [Stentor coeruleus]